MPLLFPESLVELSQAMDATALVEEEPAVAPQPLDQQPSAMDSEVLQAAIETNKPSAIQPEAKIPADLVPVDVDEAVKPESSKRWLWIIGAFVILGGLWLAFRRKN